MMGRIKLAVFLLCALTATCSAASAAEPGEALVVLRNGLAEPLTEEALASVEGRLYVAEVARGVGARVVNVYGGLSAAGGTIFALFSAEGQTSEELVEALKQCPEVLAASPNREVRILKRPRAIPSAPASGDTLTPAAKPKP